MTGKARVEDFFDPSLVSEESNKASAPFKTPSKKDGMDPNVIICRSIFCSNPVRSSNLSRKWTEEGNKDGTSGPALVETADGALHKITDSSQLMSCP